YLVFPQLLAYVSAGFTEAHFNAIDLFNAFDGGPLPSPLFIPAHTYHGWFLGSAYEYALKWLPGFFWKTEYRYSQYHAADLPVLCVTGAVCVAPEGTPDSIHAKKFEQVIRSELVWRFNWGGPAR